MARNTTKTMKTKRPLPPATPRPQKPDYVGTVNGVKWNYYELPRPKTAEFIVVIADGGIPVGINHFETRKEAMRSVREMLADHNHAGQADRLFIKRGIHVSVWRWHESRFRRVGLGKKLGGFC